MDSSTVITNPVIELEPTATAEKCPRDEMTEYQKIDGGDKGDRTISQMGFFSWRPKFLEIFNKPAAFVVTFGLSNFFLVQCVGTLSIMLPTIEKVFNLNSKETGLILMANDIAGPVAGLILANYCSSRKARSIAIGMLVVAIATIFQTSTTFYAEYPEPVATSTMVQNTDVKPFHSLCNETRPDNIDQDGPDAASRNYKYYWMFIVGAFAQGIGATPPGIAGNTYLDEIFPQSQFGIAIAVMYVISFIGYPVSLFIGGAYLTHYVTLKTPEGLRIGDPAWIGAWWLGLLVPSAFVIVFSFFLMLFPRQMPAAKKVLEEKIKKGITTSQEKANELKRSLKDVTKDTIPAFKRLLKNKSLDFLVIGDIFMFLQFGAFSFFPKIFAMMYRKTDTVIGQIYGGFTCVGFIVGLVLGSILLKRKEWPPKKLVLIFVITTVISAPFMFSLLLYCPTDTYAGYSQPYSNVLGQPCNAGCGCGGDVYRPVCDRATGLTYMSPCHAGCSAAPLRLNQTSVYVNCSCSSGTVEAGSCGDTCNGRMILSMTLYALGFGIGFSGFSAHAIIYQRVVKEVDRTLAQGLRQTATRALGTLPAPILFGYILDESCLIWKESKDGSRGNCFVYDVDKLLIVFTSLLVAFKLICSIFHALSWYFYPNQEGVVAVELEDIELENPLSHVPSMTNIHHHATKEGEDAPNGNHANGNRSGSTSTEEK